MVFFPQISPAKTLKHHSTPPYILRVPHISTPLLNYPNYMSIWYEYRSLSSSLYNFSYSPLTLSLLGPNILLSTLFSYTLSLRSSLNMSNHVSHPYKITNKITDSKKLYSCLSNLNHSKLIFVSVK